MKRVTEVGNESHRVLSSLCDRTRREKVEKTSEFTEWLNQEETRLEEASKAYADPSQFSMSLDQKSHVLIAHKKAIDDCQNSETAKELLKNASRKVVSRYNDLITSENSKLYQYEAHVKLHTDFEHLYTQVETRIKDAFGVVEKVESELAISSQEAVMVNYEKLGQINLSEVEEQLQQLIKLSVELIEESFARESSDLGSRLSNLKEDFESLQGSVSVQLSSMEQSVDEIKSFEVTKKKYQEWMHETSIQVGSLAHFCFFFTIEQRFSPLFYENE